MPKLRLDAASGGCEEVPQLVGVRGLRQKAANLTDAQALSAWVTHNPFQRATPELTRRIQKLAKCKLLADESPF